MNKIIIALLLIMVMAVPTVAIDSSVLQRFMSFSGIRAAPPIPTEGRLNELDVQDANRVFNSIKSKFPEVIDTDGRFAVISKDRRRIKNRWTFEIKNNRVVDVEEGINTPDVIINIQEKHLVQIMNNRMNRFKMLYLLMTNQITVLEEVSR